MIIKARARARGGVAAASCERALVFQ